MDAESLRVLLGQGLSVEKIARRFEKRPQTVAYWLNKYGLESPYKKKHSARGGLERERLEALVAAGMTIGEISREVGRSSGTVRYWLRMYGLKTRRARAGRAVLESHRAAGRLTVSMVCRKHGETDFILEGRGRYRCRRCRIDAVARRRRKVKAILVEEAGGRCVWLRPAPRRASFPSCRPVGKASGDQCQGNSAGSGTAASRGREVCSSVLELPRRGGGRGRYPSRTVCTRIDGD
jgi:transposase-like protein